ncbi:excalibur calcium-binding domain-containing protein [Deinococcus alpinitundrae]|uniref:excalibur calcium-binding domain-containing protein n=1 Tax=Deinococcus alpinitundrae TaxID=468913 RepID=UPI00192A26A2|nr:excalibur calcium-binding domain-containing protein [Deinococcus alpinitundrae]
MKKYFLIAATLFLTACGSMSATPPADQGPTPPSNANSGHQYPVSLPTASGHAFQGSLTATTAGGTGDLDCRDFTSQSEAQAYFNSNDGSSTNNVDALDWNHNGTPCEVNESWAIRSKRWAVPTPPVVTPTPPVVTPTPPSTGMCWVNGYYRKDGTYVHGYYRHC